MEKVKRTGIVLLSILIIVLVFAVLYYSLSFSKDTVIRRTLFLSGHPIGAFTTSIQDNPDVKDKLYGDCYVIQNDKINNGTENSIPGVCMKKNKYGLYYDVTIGAW